MLYEIHILKNYAPTNLNRDDSGAPKTCQFGGVNRGRISSQCLKRSWRTSSYLKERLGAEHLGIRTRQLPDFIGSELLNEGIDEEWVDAIKPKLGGFGTKEGKDSKDNRTAQVIFYSAHDLISVKEVVLEALKNCKSVKDVKALKAKDLQDTLSKMKVRPVSLDVALFGRMVTSDAFADVEASMQVSHAFSTGKIAVESDYWTAMDDLLTGDSMDENGAGGIGEVDFNSACYYLYASIDSDALAANLKDAENVSELVQKTIPVLLETMAFTNPSGKQNSFAGHSLPSAVLVECKEQKIPTSFANAFVKPVHPEGGKDSVEVSIERLAKEVSDMEKDFCLPVANRFWFCARKYDVKPDCNAICCNSFGELVHGVAATFI